MGMMQELLDSLTDEDGIRPDFVEAVRNAYDTDNEGNLTRIGELEGQLADSAAEQENILKAHANEITALKASFFDQIRSGNVTTEVEANVVEPETESTPFYVED